MASAFVCSCFVEVVEEPPQKKPRQEDTSEMLQRVKAEDGMLTRGGECYLDTDYTWMQLKLWLRISSSWNVRTPSTADAALVWAFTPIVE